MTSETMVSLICDAQNALVRVKYWINDGQDPENYNARTGDLQDLITLLQEVQKNVTANYQENDVSVDPCEQNLGDWKYNKL